MQQDADPSRPMTPQTSQESLRDGGRIWGVDLARTGALIAMAVFHFVYDLQLFGLIAPGTVAQPGWRWLAYLTAGSFLFLAGVSLWLAHAQAIRWAGFWRRLLRVALAAGLITGVTLIAIPDMFIFFGILHAIAAGSLVGLAALRLPATVLLVLGAAVVALPQMVRLDALSAPVWWWLGLQSVPIRSADYVPLLPWAGPLLWGIAVAKLAGQAGLWARLRGRAAGPWVRALAWPGQHSLWVYLLHQPVLIALIWLATRF